MEPLSWPLILARMALAFWPVWLALVLTFGLSFTFRRRLGLYGRLFSSPAGSLGFGLVMFWIFTALFAGLIVTFDPLAQLSGLKNAAPGTALQSPAAGAYPWYLLGGDGLARDVFSRMVAGAREVLKIAPAATVFAFLAGITLGLPAGYSGGWTDALLSFLANLVLAFPVILLFYLLVTPEIVQTGIPQRFAAVLFLFPVLFFCLLFHSRFHRQRAKYALLMGVTLTLGLWIWAGMALNRDPFGIFSLTPNMLNVFVSVVFVNAPGVFRITRGLTMDVSARDYIAAARSRGEGYWYILLWEILPNLRGPLIVDFCLRIGYTTILLGTLGFFGLGVSPESPDWGSTINAGSKLMGFMPHMALVPAIALMSLVLGLNLLADGLREESLKD